MPEDYQAAERQRRIPPGLDPRAYDPRKAIDPAVLERMVRTQSAVRAQAHAASTVYLATVLSLATSAFGLVAAFAWNNAITQILDDNLNGSLKALGWPKGTVLLVYALIVTAIGVAVIAILNRIGKRIATRNALDSSADAS